MNMFKKNGGFTLVELIVVIAILAILAGIAVPAYTGYITRAQDAAVISELSAVLTAAQGALASDGEEVTAIAVAADGTITINEEEAPAMFATLYGSATFKGTLTGTSYAGGANWASNEWSPVTTPPATT